jgi:hypothetical protein
MNRRTFLKGVGAAMAVLCLPYRESKAEPMDFSLKLSDSEWHHYCCMEDGWYIDGIKTEGKRGDTLNIGPDSQYWFTAP